MNYEGFKKDKSFLFKKVLRRTVLSLITVSIINIVSLPIARASELSTVFSGIVMDIVLEYEKANLQVLKNYITPTSLEELFISAEKHNHSAQKILFFMYYLAKSHTFKNQTVVSLQITLTDNTVLELTLDHITRIEKLIKKTNTVDAYFLLGLSYIKTGDKRQGLYYLNMAKETGYALAYLVITALKLREETLPDIKKQNIKIAYQSLQEMRQRGIAKVITAFDFLMGTILFLKNQDSNALKLFNNSIHKWQYAIAASLSYMGMIHERNNRTDLAKNFFIQAIKNGNDTSKMFLISIYTKEGNYAELSKLLKEISTTWGKYKDVASIKASFLLSYMFRQGIGFKKDLMQSYIYANRAKEIYLISSQQQQSYIDPSTGRYQVLLHPEQRMINFSNNFENNHSSAKHNLPTYPDFVFQLMGFENNTLLTEKQLSMIQSHIFSLEREIKNSNTLPVARFLASADFEKLYMPSICREAFLN